MGKRSISEGDRVAWRADGTHRTGRVRTVVRHPQFLGPVEATPPTVPDDTVMVEVTPDAGDDSVWLPSCDLVLE